MVKQYASLAYIENNRRITKEADEEFLHQLQTGLLLALKEQGILNELQYRHAQDRLDQQRRISRRADQKKGKPE